jgi:hypothetical protein
MCYCIHKVNALLKERNGILETNWLSSPARAMVSVCKKEARGKKPPLMEATHCPFCGEKYEERKSDLARDLAAVPRL